MSQEKKPCCSHKEKKLYKPSELPIYGNPNPPKDVVQSNEIGLIESNIMKGRQELGNYFSIITNASRRTQEIVSTAYQHSKSTYDYIVDEANTVPKAIAITSGGLIGIVLSSRKGVFKKITYTGLGMLSAAAACYPKEAKEIGQLSFYIMKTYGPHLVKEYTGIDLSQGISGVIKKTDKTIESENKEQKDSQQAKEKTNVESSVSNAEVKNSQPNAEVKNSQPSKTTEGDFGQSNPQDKDLYSNKSTK